MSIFSHIIQNITDPANEAKIQKISGIISSMSVGVTVTIIQLNWGEVFQAWVTAGGSAAISGLIGLFLPYLIRKLFKQWQKKE